MWLLKSLIRRPMNLRVLLIVPFALTVAHQSILVSYADDESLQLSNPAEKLELRSFIFVNTPNATLPAFRLEPGVGPLTQADSASASASAPAASAPAVASAPASAPEKPAGTPSSDGTALNPADVEFTPQDAPSPGGASTTETGATKKLDSAGPASQPKVVIIRESASSKPASSLGQMTQEDQGVQAACMKVEKDPTEDNLKDFLDKLKDTYGSRGVKKNERVVKNLEHEVFDKVFDESDLENRLGEADSLEDLEDLIGEIVDFAKDHKKSDVIRDRCIKLLSDESIESLAKKAWELEIERETPAVTLRKFKVVEKALMAAYRLNPKNHDLLIKAREILLQRAQFAASTGNDRFYNGMVRGDVFNAMNDLYSRIMFGGSNSRDLLPLYRHYQRVMNPNRPLQSILDTPMGPQVGINPYQPYGDALDKTFSDRAVMNFKRSMEEEFRAYRNDLSYGVPALGSGGDAMSMSGGAGPGAPSIAPPPAATGTAGGSGSLGPLAF